MCVEKCKNSPTARRAQEIQPARQCAPQALRDTPKKVAEYKTKHCGWTLSEKEIVDWSVDTSSMLRTAVVVPSLFSPTPSPSSILCSLLVVLAAFMCPGTCFHVAVNESKEVSKLRRVDEVGPSPRGPSVHQSAVPGLSSNVFDSGQKRIVERFNSHPKSFQRLPCILAVASVVAFAA